MAKKSVVLEAQGLTKRFTEGRLDVTVLQGVDLQVRAGETLAIVGASGSGKSTLLHLLGGLDAPTSGQRAADGGRRCRAVARRAGRSCATSTWAFVYQFHHLLPEFSALDNVAMPLWIRRLPRPRPQRAERVLARVGLADAPAPPPGRAVGRRAPARGHCPRPGHAPGLRAGRRAHRQPGPQHRRRRVRPDAATGRATRARRL
jgi:lipoprotein-releasing system ATP-binding protein